MSRRDLLSSLATLAGLLGLWWLATHAGWVSRAFVPTPEATAASLAEGLRGEWLAYTAARQVEPQLLEVSAALQLSPNARFVKVVLPAMLPRLFVALRLGVAIALVVAVTVEIAANPHGMGYAMMIAQQSLEPATMLAWLAWIGCVGWLVNAAALALQRKVARRLGESTT